MANGEGKGGGTGDVFSDKREAIRENARATEEANRSTSQYSETQEELARNVVANIDNLKNFDQALEDSDSRLRQLIDRSKEWAQQFTDTSSAVTGLVDRFKPLTILQKRYQLRLDELNRSQKEFNASLFQSSKSVEQSRKRHDAYLKTIKQGHMDAIDLANKYNLSAEETKKMTEELTSAFANQIQSYGDQSKALSGLQKQTLVFSKVMGVDTTQSIKFMRQQLEASGRTLDDVQRLTRAAALAADNYAKWLDSLGEKSRRVARITKKDLLDAIQKTTDAYSTGKVEMEGFIAIQDNLIKRMEKAGVTSKEAKKLLGDFGVALANIQDEELRNILTIKALPRAVEQGLQHGDEALKRRIRAAQEESRIRGEGAEHPHAIRRMIGALRGSLPMLVEMRKELLKQPKAIQTEFLKQAGIEGQFGADVLLRAFGEQETGEELTKAMKEQTNAAVAAKQEQKSAWDKLIETTKAGHQTQQGEYQVAVDIREAMQSLDKLLHYTQPALIAAVAAGGIGGAIGGIKRIFGRGAGRAAGRTAATRAARTTATRSTVKGAGRSALLRTGAKTTGGVALTAGGAYGVSQVIPGTVSAAPAAAAEKKAVAGTVSLTSEQFAKVSGKETAEKAAKKGTIRKIAERVGKSGAMKAAGRGAAHAIPILNVAMAAYDAYMLIEHAGGAIAAQLDKEAGAIMRRSGDKKLSGWFGAQAAKTSEDWATKFADTVMTNVAGPGVVPTRKKLGGAYRHGAPKWIDKISDEEMNVRLRTLDARKEHLKTLNKRQEHIKKHTFKEDKVLAEKIDKIQKIIKQDEKIIDLKRKVIKVDEQASKETAFTEGREGMAGFMEKLKGAGRLTPEKLKKLAKEYFGDAGRLMKRKGYGQDVLKDILTGRFGKGEELKALAAEGGMDYETFKNVMSRQLTREQLGRGGFLTRRLAVATKRKDEYGSEKAHKRLMKGTSLQQRAEMWMKLQQAGKVGQKSLRSPWIANVVENIKAEARGAGISFRPEVSFEDSGEGDMPQDVKADTAKGEISFYVPFSRQKVTLRTDGISTAVASDQYNKSDRHT